MFDSNVKSSLQTLAACCGRQTGWAWNIWKPSKAQRNKPPTRNHTLPVWDVKLSNDSISFNYSSRFPVDPCSILFFSVTDRLGQLNTKPRSRWPAWTRPWLAAGSYYKQHSRPPCVTAGRTPWYPPWAACHRTPVSIICGTFFVSMGKWCIVGIMTLKYLKHSSTALQTIQESMLNRSYIVYTSELLLVIRWSLAAHTTVSLHQPFVRCSGPALPFHSASVATALGLLPPKKQKPRRQLEKTLLNHIMWVGCASIIFWAFLIPGNSKKDDPFWESNKQHSDRANPPPPHRFSFVQAVGQGWPQTPARHFWCSLICCKKQCECQNALIDLRNPS